MNLHTHRNEQGSIQAAFTPSDEIGGVFHVESRARGRLFVARIGLVRLTADDLEEMHAGEIAEPLSRYVKHTPHEEFTYKLLQACMGVVSAPSPSSPNTIPTEIERFSELARLDTDSMPGFLLVDHIATEAPHLSVLE